VDTTTAPFGTCTVEVAQDATGVSDDRHSVSSSGGSDALASASITTEPLELRRHRLS
jgi:hypothetical protein